MLFKDWFNVTTTLSHRPIVYTEAVKMSGFDRLLTKAASVMSQKMADLVLVPMAEPQGKCFWRF